MMLVLLREALAAWAEPFNAPDNAPDTDQEIR